MVTVLDGAVHDPLDPLCFGLRAQLGRFGYQWLCASAVYPRLRFAFSCYLGSALAQTHRRSPISEPEMLALFRLPWFRTGFMPQDLRIRLLADLEAETREAALSAITQAFYGATIDKDGEQSRAPLLLGPTPDHVKAALRTYVDRSPADAVEHDIIFARTLASAETTAAAIARDRARIGWLGWSATRLLVPANLVLLAAISLLAVAWLTTDLWLRPLFRTVSAAITQTEPAPTNGIDPADNAVPAENALENAVNAIGYENAAAPVGNFADATGTASQGGKGSGSLVSTRLNIPRSKLASMLRQEQRKFLEENNGAETATVSSGYEKGRAFFYYFVDDQGGPARFKKDVASGDMIFEGDPGMINAN